MSVHQNPGTANPRDPLLKHLRPRRALGQSFLTYEPVADALVEALGVCPTDTVLEVGPGKGMLTRRLVTLADRVIELTGSSSRKEFVPYEVAYGRPIEDMMRRVPSTARIREAIGWQPQTSLDETLRIIIEHCRLWVG